MSDGEVAYYSDDFEEEDEERRLSPVKQSRGRPPSRLNLAPHLVRPAHHARCTVARDRYQLRRDAAHLPLTSLPRRCQH
jgi:hypothetical protein